MFAQVLALAAVAVVPLPTAVVVPPSPPALGYVQAVETSGLGNITAPVTDGHRTGWSVPMIDAGSSGKTTVDFVRAEGIPDDPNFTDSKRYTTNYHRLLNPIIKSGEIHVPLAHKRIGAGSGVADSQTYFGNGSFPGTVARSHVYCSYTDADVVPVSSIVKYSFGHSGTMTGNGVPASYDSNVSTTKCPRLIAIEVTLRYSMGGQPAAFVDLFEWTAYDYLIGRPSALPGDPMVDVCNTPGALELYPECRWHIPDIDATNFSEVCAGAPDMAWLDFSWLPATIGHFSECLFRPAGGWDYKQRIPEYAGESSLAAIGVGIEEAANAFRVTGGCGPLIHGDAGPLGTVSMSTCDWPANVSQLKTLLTWAVYIAFAIYALSFIARTLTGVVNKKTPAPLGGDSE